MRCPGRSAENEGVAVPGLVQRRRVSQRKYFSGALEVTAHCPGHGDLGGQLSGARDATPFPALGLWSSSNSAASMYGCPG
jgi:hypothetical protein